jgi:diguanylate cyclase (GGDEF)-like protein
VSDVTIGSGGAACAPTPGVDAGTDGTNEEGAAPAPGAGAATRIAALGLGLLVLGVVLYAVGPTRAPVGADIVELRWWALVPAFVLAEMLVVHLELRGDAHTFTLAEIPLLLGLCFASPLHLVIGRLVGEGLVLTCAVRQPVGKVAFNQSLFFAETAVATTVFGLVARGGTVEHWSTWVGGFAAIAASNGVGTVAVALAIWWHSGHRDIAGLLTGSALTTSINTSLALNAVLLASVDPAAVTVVVAIVAFCYLLCRGNVTLRQRYESVSALYEFSRIVNDTRDTASVVDAMLAHTCTLLRAERAELMLFAAGTGDPVRMGAGGVRLTPLWTVVDELPSSVAEVLDDEHPVVLARRKARNPALDDLLGLLGAQDAMLTPIRADGIVIGLLAVLDRSGDVSTFDHDDAKAFATFASYASVALEKSSLLVRLQEETSGRAHDALHDVLTGLPNRLHVTEHLAAVLDARRESDAVAVVVVNLDRFREVNDTLGHRAGDAVLVEVVRRFRTVAADGAFLGRLGADEFAVCLHGVADARGPATDLATALLRSLDAHIDLDGLRLQVTASAGASLAPEHGTDPATLLQRADIGMHGAKTARSRTPAVYDPSRDENTLRRLALATDLRDAIQRREITVAYQPKARLSDGVVVSVEALARWRHPEHGPVPPDEFVLLAERTGLIDDLTEVVLRQALEQQRRWHDQGLRLGVAVNLSVRVLHAALPGQVRRLLALTGANTEGLVFEITESSVMTEPDRVIEVLHELAAMGIALSIDDFGTGYSSLAYLQRMPVREVKIDKSFVFPMVADAGAAAIVRSVVDLARNLGLRVVAEGVEDQAAWDALAAVGCDVAQGYFLSRPVPADDLTPWLLARTEAGPSFPAPAPEAPAPAR